MYKWQDHWSKARFRENCTSKQNSSSLWLSSFRTYSILEWIRCPSGDALSPIFTYESGNPHQTVPKMLYVPFSTGLLRTTLLIWFLYLAVTFTYYGIILITTELSSRENECGLVFIPLTGQKSNLYFDTFITSTYAGSITLSNRVQKILMIGLT